MKGHICKNPNSFPRNKFHQRGVGKGRKVLIVGESPAPNGWIISGKACYRPDGKILPTGKRMNELLSQFDLSVETVGFTELVKCFVSKRTELKECSVKCWDIFVDQLSEAEYTFLIVLGVHTTQLLSNLLDEEIDMGKMNTINIRNKKYQILPIFHPSPINPTGHKKNIEIFTNMDREISLMLEKA